MYVGTKIMPHAPTALGAAAAASIVKLNHFVAVVGVYAFRKLGE